MIKKPLVLYRVLNRDLIILGIQNQGFLNQVPTLPLPRRCGTSSFLDISTGSQRVYVQFVQRFCGLSIWSLLKSSGGLGK